MADNNENLFDNDSSFFEQGAGPTEANHLHFESRTNFFPWHKPRKHFLRINQWTNSVGKLVDSLNLKQKNRSLQYLSLPGPDLLDVRALEPMCQDKDIKLSFLGLNDGGSDTQKHLSSALLNQVLALPSIDSLSSVVPDKFEHLSKKDTIAYDRVIASHRSFDVINVDLCGTLAETPPGQPGPTLVNAIFNLINHQAKSRSEDWLLFITTRSNRDMVDPETMKKIICWLNELIDSDKSLIDNYIDNGFITKEELTDGKIDFLKLSAGAHSAIFSVGMGHWIFESLFNNEPVWRADMLPQYGYHVQLKDEACDMISMGFYCKRITAAAPQDLMGIAHVPVNNNIADICQTKKNAHNKIHRRVQELCDVDVKLHNEPELYRTSLSGSAKILKDALYDEAKYLEFAEEQRKMIEIFLRKSNLISIDWH